LLVAYGLAIGNDPTDYAMDYHSTGHPSPLIIWWLIFYGQHFPPIH
jgi:hypothetical protein